MKKVNLLIAFLFVLSGITGLVYEVLWAKILTAVLGSSAQANSIVLATFLGGLALGNHFFGRFADRFPNGFRLYGWLELGIGLTAGLSLVFFHGVSELYYGAATSFPKSTFLLGFFRALLAVIVMLIPTALMGGTLPALTTYVTSSKSQVRDQVSRLYYLNSAGAVIGALIAAFYLIPAFGLHLPISMAALVNLALGAIALLAARRFGATGAKKTASSAASERKSAGKIETIRKIAYAAAFITGVISLTYEVAWIRTLALVLGSSTYSFSVMLAAFITGITIGSWAVHRLRPAEGHDLKLLALSQAGVAASIALTLPLYDRLPYAFLMVSSLLSHTPESYPFFEAIKFLFCFALMAVPTFLMGSSLPLAASLCARSNSTVGRDVGSLFSFNTAGNVIGALMAGLWLLPLLGIETLFRAGIVANLCLAAFLGWTALKSEPRSRIRWLLPACLAIAVLSPLAGRWDMTTLSSGAFRLRSTIPGKGFEDFKKVYQEVPIVFQKEDSHGSVTVVAAEPEPGKERGELILKVNGKPDASSTTDLPTQLLSAQIPLFLRPSAKNVLVVGMGSGITAGSALVQPIERLDLVEISDAVIEGSRLFGPENHHVHDNPRFHTHIDDAKSFLRIGNAGMQYDVIISEPSNPWMAGVGNLFTTQFYEASKSRLTQDGIFVQWVHGYEMSDDLFLTELRTFAASFPHVSTWKTLHGDVVLLGSEGKLEADFRSIEARIASSPEIRQELARVGITKLSSLLSLNFTTPGVLAALTGEGPLNDADFPLLEYGAPKAFFLGTTTGVLERMDDRVRPEAAGGLALPRYLRARGRPMLSAEELAEIYLVNKGASPHFAETAKTALLARGGTDRRLVYGAAISAVGSATPELALAQLERLGPSSPQDWNYQRMHLDLAIKAAIGSRSIANPVQSVEKSLALTTGLVARWPAHRPFLLLRRAEILEGAGRWEEAFGSMDLAIEAAKVPGSEPEASRESLLARASNMAFRAGAFPKAAQYVKETLSLNPLNSTANQIASALRVLRESRGPDVSQAGI